MPAITIPACALLVMTSVPLVYWSIAAWRIHRMVVRRLTVRRGIDVAAPVEGWPTVSIIVPVHNEQRVIDDCAASLRGQDYSALEIIFVLDRCTDNTRAILEEHAAADQRIVLLENDTCPTDWAGKCHAARLGADRARGTWLLFTDADTAFDPALTRAAMALAHEAGITLLSLLSTLVFHHRFERIAQPVATMNLIRMYPIERVNYRNRDNARPFANGQFMLFDRTWYERIGGHAAVRDDLLEDIAFARRMHAEGGRCAVYLADGMLTCSMYDSLPAFEAGWKRIFIEACKRKPGRLRKNALRILLNGLGAPVAQIAGLVAGAVACGSGPVILGVMLLGVVVAGWFVQVASLMRVYAMGGAPIRAVWLYPLGCWTVGRLMLAGARDLARRRPIRWAGKEYVLTPR